MTVLRLVARCTRPAPAILALLVSATSLPAQSLTARYRATADRIIAESMKDSAAWNRIALLTETFGNRLSGSTALEQAIDWVMARMKEDGLDNVHAEAVMVPHWVRGAESAEMLTPRRARLPTRPPAAPEPRPSQEMRGRRSK